MTSHPEWESRLVVGAGPRSNSGTPDAVEQQRPMATFWTTDVLEGENPVLNIPVDSAVEARQCAGDSPRAGKGSQRRGGERGEMRHHAPALNDPEDVSGNAEHAVSSNGGVGTTKKEPVVGSKRSITWE